MAEFRPFLTELSDRNTSVFYFQDNNSSKSRWNFTKFDMCIDIVEVGCGISFWQNYLPTIHPYFTFRTITWVHLNGFHQIWYVQWYCRDLLRYFLLANFVHFWQISARRTSVLYFQDNSLSKSQWISPNLICALILLRSALGFFIGKFRHFLTKLSARDMIMAGYYRFTFYF